MPPVLQAVVAKRFRAQSRGSARAPAPLSACEAASHPGGEPIPTPTCGPGPPATLPPDTPMLPRLILLFTLVPLLELFFLIRIGEWIGLWPTIGLVIVTGIVGGSLAKREGSRSWTAVKREFAEGRFPGAELCHAVMILVAGILLVTPGVFTDVIGVAVLLRPVRAAVIRILRRRFGDSLRGGRTIDL